MQKDELSLLLPGDMIDYRSKRLTPHGLVDVGITQAQVIGVTGESALIKSRGHPSLTIAVQAKDIVAAYRMQEGGVILLYYGERPPTEET